MLLKTEKLSYWYTNKEDYLFKDLSVEFTSGKVYAILGQSGSGKTTLLSLLSGLDNPKEGSVMYGNETIEKNGLTKYRQNSVSTIFQAYNLLTYMTARENVKTALEISGKSSQDETIEKLFEKVGIAKDLIDKPVLKLSGGQQQRVAIVRALATNHEIIIADEPTGNLDEKTTDDIVNIFRTIAHDEGKLVIIVTHEQSVANQADFVYELSNKELVKIS
ncbi:ATP-binding cassette domain-containing protein [Streptococcus parauberis]|uniref:ATP-binding cassette domain-containing protein n=1 Tax=Streptococcus parauberis TaxID=1348 RepID=UPI00056AC7ED|nr:ATP-binding cassette domain-containing protein [Streptococcus parauberis]